jgi:hypothetical protein
LAVVLAEQELQVQDGCNDTRFGLLHYIHEPLFFSVAAAFAADYADVSAELLHPWISRQICAGEQATCLCSFVQG